MSFDRRQEWWNAAPNMNQKSFYTLDQWINPFLRQLDDDKLPPWAGVMAIIHDMNMNGPPGYLTFKEFKLKYKIY